MYELNGKDWTMLTEFQKKSLKQEIKYNLREIYWRIIFSSKLIARYFKQSIKRNENVVLAEYEAGWDEFWKKGYYFENDKYPFIDNGKLMHPMISPHEYQVVLIEKISHYLRKNNCKSVLEIGSGTGLNLLNLAPLFPDVQFYGLELTKSGVMHSERVFANPPVQFELAHQQGKINNVHMIHGNILHDDTINQLKRFKFDFVFTSLVLEQLYHYLDVVFENIFKLDLKYFYFNEQWFEFNTHVAKYRTLLEHDYFRASLEILNHFPAKVIETTLSAKQPMGMNIAGVYGQKVAC